MLQAFKTSQSCFQDDIGTISTRDKSDDREEILNERLQVCDDLSNLSRDIPKLTEQDQDYQNNSMTIPSFLSKTKGSKSALKHIFSSMRARKLKQSIMKHTQAHFFHADSPEVHQH